MLEEAKVRVQEERLSKKNPLSDAEAAALLGRVSEVRVAKGRALRILAAKDATVEDLRGPTGGIRAPLVLLGKTLLVGFHDATLRAMVSGRA